jgi:hypothetical protein
MEGKADMVREIRGEGGNELVTRRASRRTAVAGAVTAAAGSKESTMTAKTAVSARAGRHSMRKSMRGGVCNG